MPGDAARPRERGDRIRDLFAAVHESGDGTKRTFKVLRRRSDVEGRADMARTLPERDPRYATDFLPRMDGAGRPPGGGGASGSWWPWPFASLRLNPSAIWIDTASDEYLAAYVRRSPTTPAISLD